MDDVLRISGRTGAAADKEKGVDSVGDDHKEEVVAEVKLFVHLRSVYYMSWNIITNIIVQMYCNQGIYLVRRFLQVQKQVSEN